MGKLENDNAEEIELRATRELREMAAGLGIEFGALGPNSTLVHQDDITWQVADRYDGTLTACILQPLSPARLLEVLGVRHTATMHVVADGNGVGRSWCGACGKLVGQHARYCSECGRKFTAIARETKDEA